MRSFVLVMAAALCMRIADPPAFGEEGPTRERVRSVLIVDGMNNHDWARNTRILKKILERSGLFSVVFL